MGKAASTPPLFFQSKLLCFSLLYLSSSLFFSLYISLSKTKCLVRSSPFEHLQTPLFSYPSSYGEHKYAIPTVRSTCSSPVFFSGTTNFSLVFCTLYVYEFRFWVLTTVVFHKWLLVFASDYGTVVKKIQDLCRTSSSSVLRYLEGNYDTFGGNFTAHQRFSNFDHQNDTTRIPCGFLKEFPITDSG